MEDRKRKRKRDRERRKYVGDKCRSDPVANYCFFFFLVELMKVFVPPYGSWLIFCSYFSVGSDQHNLVIEVEDKQLGNVFETLSNTEFIPSIFFFFFSFLFRWLVSLLLS